MRIDAHDSTIGTERPKHHPHDNLLRGLIGVVEGLAEYYGLQLLRRSGTISTSRYDEALRELALWADDAAALCSSYSGGATTALAVTVLEEYEGLEPLERLLIQLADFFDRPGLYREQ